MTKSFNKKPTIGRHCIYIVCTCTSEHSFVHTCKRSASASVLSVVVVIVVRWTSQHLERSPHHVVMEGAIQSTRSKNIIYKSTSKPFSIFSLNFTIDIVRSVSGEQCRHDYCAEWTQSVSNSILHFARIANCIIHYCGYPSSIFPVAPHPRN